MEANKSSYTTLNPLDLFQPALSSIFLFPLSLSLFPTDWTQRLDLFCTTALPVPSTSTVFSHQYAHVNLHCRLASRSHSLRGSGYGWSSPASGTYFSRPRHCLWRCPRSKGYKAASRGTQTRFRGRTGPHHQRRQLLRYPPFHLLWLERRGTDASGESWIRRSHLFDSGALSIRLGRPHHHWPEL